jgi:transcriptional regulator with XRE-family HTH domain
MKFFLSSNLKVLRERRNRSQQDMADFIGITRSILNNYENGISNPSIENLLKISDYFNININTLLTVDFSKLSGKHLAELEKGLDVYVKGSQLRVLATTVNEKNEDNVEMVSTKAKAGYTTGYADPEYISKLPTYTFPFLPKDKKHRAFQVSGDSMLPIHDKSWVVGQYVDDWTGIQNGQEYIVVTKEDGVVFKLAYNQIKEKGSVLLVSANPIYKPYELEIENVREVWKVVMRLENGKT